MMHAFALLISTWTLFHLPVQLDSSLQAVLVKKEFITTNPPFATCHSSSIVELSKDKLMAAWFAGSYEGAPDVGIWTSVNINGIWSSPVEVASSFINDSLKLPCWNPVLFKSNDGRLYLFYKQGKSPREWWGLVKFSDNDGFTWNEPKKLPDGFLGPIKNKPVQLKTGEIFCPSSTESFDEKHWHIHLEITDKTLSSWKKITVDTISSFGVIQPAILQHPDGKLQMLSRSRENCIVQTWSSDKGLNWSPLSCIDVPNPNAGIDAVTLSNNFFAMVYNPLLKGADWYIGRNILKVAVSTDGTHWKDVYILENENKGEYSYPAIIQTSDGLVHISYTFNRKKIRHVVLKLKH
jgi:alpha-L-fucosidase